MYKIVNRISKKVYKNTVFFVTCTLNIIHKLKHNKAGRDLNAVSAFQNLGGHSEPLIKKNSFYLSSQKIIFLWK